MASWKNVTSTQLTPSANKAVKNIVLPCTRSLSPARRRRTASASSARQTAQMMATLASEPSTSARPRPDGYADDEGRALRRAATNAMPYATVWVHRGAPSGQRA